MNNITDIRVESFRKKLANDLNDLETSQLKKVNYTLYEELKNMFRDLDEKITIYEMGNGNITWKSILDESATMGTLFEFYMEISGAKEVASYQTETIKEQLEKIAEALNADNYYLISKEIEDALNLYSDILTTSRSIEIDKIVNEFYYKILKFKINDMILDDSHDFRDFIVLVLNDIDLVINDAEVSLNIKKLLEKYAIDKELVLDNFVKVMRLIVLAETKKQVTDEELENYLNIVIYKESEIQKEYHEPSKEVVSASYGVPDDLEKIFEYSRDLAKEAVPNVVLEKIRYGSFGLPGAVTTLVEEQFEYVKYFADALLANGFFGWMMSFKRLFKSARYDVDKEFDKAVIAYRDKLRAQDLAEYIIENNNDFLINYVINNKDIKVTGLFTSDFIDYIVSSNNNKLKAYLEGNILHIKLLNIINSSADLELKKKAIRYAINESLENREKLVEILNQISKTNEDSLIDFIDQVIIEAQNIDVFIYYVSHNRALDTISDKTCRLVDRILKGEFKERLLDVLYDTETEIGKILIRDIKTSALDLKNYVPFNATIFEAAYASRYVDNPKVVIDFIRQYHKARLSWENLVRFRPLLGYEVNEFDKYLYLGDKELFFQVEPKPSLSFVLEMIKEYPESIVDFFGYLWVSNIINLPLSALDIFVKYYNDKINKEGTNIMTLVHNTLGKSKENFNERDAYELLTYIMHTGIINNEVLMYAKTIPDASQLNSLFVRAVSNSKTPYLRAGFATKLYSLNENDWDVIFMSEKELEDLKNNPEDNPDTIDLKLRKYYGDLLKLMPKVPEYIRHRIVVEVAKSGIHEYINYIVINNPELIDIILENIDDNELYKKIMVISLEGSGRK